MKSFLGALTLLVPAALAAPQSPRAVAAPPSRASGAERAAPAQLGALVSEPELRWSFGPLAFETEALVATLPEGERVLVSGRDPTGRRALVVLEAETGRVLSRTLFAAKAPLALAQAGEHVAVRTAPNRVDLFRLRGARLLLERSFVHESSVSAPVLAQGELVLREGDELACYDLEQREPVWRARAPAAFHGAPAARENGVFAVWYEADGTAHLAWLERASGRLLGDVALGRHRQGSEPEPDAPEVVAHASVLFVRLPPGLPATSGQTLEWARIPWDGERLANASLHDFLAPPLETDAGWVAPENTASGARWILARRDSSGEGAGERVIELASSEHHAWLSTSHTPASRAGDVLYIGPAAVDARTLQVLWRRARNPDFRPVPVAAGLLVIEGDRLHRLGGPEREPDRARERTRALALAQERELGERLAQLASKALRAGDAELAQRCVVEAEGLGASGRTLALVRAEAERAGATNHCGAASDGRGAQRRAALLSEERAAREALPRALADAARLAGDSSERRALLVELFERAPASPHGLQELQRLLPEGIDVTSGAPLAWLELLELSAKSPIEIVQAAADEAAPSPEERRLADERARWRSDALGYQSARLFVVTAGVTAGAAPDAVARTVQAGELVCDVLEEVFGGSSSAAKRLELVLYPTRAEYLEHSDSDLGGLESVLGFTAGHFDLKRQVSRLFLPSQDEDSARLLGVSVHELTHHWLAMRSRFAPPRSAPTTKGFWVVEAIATWAEELRLDTERGSWSTAPERAASLDTVANAGPKDLLDWGTLLGASFEDFKELETRPTCVLSLDWQLGSRSPRSPMQLFYAQGGALAHYLYEAEGPSGRALLLRAVETYYRGAPEDIAAALGVTPAELGARVTAWVRNTRGSPSR